VRAALGPGAREAVRVLLPGARALSGGFDLAVNDRPAPTRRAGSSPPAAKLLLDLHTPQPVVVACTGHALAAGAHLARQADRRVGVSGDFKSGLNEVPSACGCRSSRSSWRASGLSKRISRPATVLARVYSPAESVRCGLSRRDRGFIQSDGSGAGGGRDGWLANVSPARALASHRPRSSRAQPWSSTCAHA
jgi:enoyl-CoA hydratase